MRPLPNWAPAETARLASSELQVTVQDTADFAIYCGIVCGPSLLLSLLVGAVARIVYVRLNRAPEQVIRERE